MNMNKLITFAAVAASAAIPMAANAAFPTAIAGNVVTNTVDGITWRYLVDEANKQVRILSTSGKDTGAIISTATAGTFYIPATLVHTNGVTYNVVSINHNGLGGCTSLTGVVFPETTFAQTTGDWGYTSGLNGKELFKGDSKLVAVWWKGPQTVSSGSQPVAKSGRTTYTFHNCKALKAVVFGPNVLYSNDGGSSYSMFRGCSGVKAFFPKARWKNLGSTSITDNVSQCKPIFYGPGEDIDVSIDGTFTVATAERLDDVLSVAENLYTHCRMTPRIAVTNTIEFTEGLITTARTKHVDFASLMFSAKTQTQLDAILAAVPSSVPVSIDPTGLTENMTIPDDYPNVFVKTVPGVTVKRTASGFMIIVK